MGPGMGRECNLLDRLDTVAIIGVGLIGGSVGLALRRSGLANRVLGIGRDENRLAEAKQIGAIDEIATNWSRGVADAEVVVVCTPVTRVVRDVLNASRDGRDDVLITDAGSTKRDIVEQVEAHEVAHDRFVGAHPLAGSERKGAAHASAGLFDGRSCVLTPTGRTPPDRLDRARSFWSSLGCRLIEMGPVTHDDALARTSHLPHVTAAALAAVVPKELLPLAAGAYRDGTRVAMSDAALWSGIFLANRRPVLDAVEALREQLSEFEHALRSEDEMALRRWWESSRRKRSEFSDPGLEIT